MRAVGLITAGAALAVAALAGTYGGWLLASPDYDGGRTFVGSISAAIAAAALVAGVLLIRFSSSS